MRSPNLVAIHLRLTETEAALIDRAARLRGQSRTAFVRAAAKQAAADARSEASPWRMSAEAFEAFTRAVSAPAAPVPEMLASLRRKAPWEQAPVKR
ncbi:type II toxin-antitoxin system TacA family antitoxin [Acidiphilium multivorum]|uniref:type II toxin-antitoxin system TacA family antitoxin n=1 Tax=Acidiphilium multivorum TaxID=62140 RepID=UPI002016A420|nr:DUF1778 domain-containing protein [Acidiphilium multivorum]